MRMLTIQGGQRTKLLTHQFDLTMKKHYRITSNGFICLFHNGIKTSTHFYSKGDELELEAFGYERI